MRTNSQWIADFIIPHEQDLRAWLRRRLPSMLELDDVVQEAYAVLANLKDVSHITKPRAYLFTTAQSVVLQHVRRAQVVSFETIADLDSLEAGHDQFNPERHAVAGEELRRLAAGIMSLPEKCRTAFVFRKVHGLSQKEIAERMGISENTVEKHIGKGLRALMEEVKDGARAVRKRGAGKIAYQADQYERRE